MSIVTTSIEDRIKAAQLRIDRSRARSEDMFDSLRQREQEVAIGTPLPSREEQLTAMLSRIKVNLPGVVYGKASDGVVLSGLPHQLQKTNQIS